VDEGCAAGGAAGAGETVHLLHGNPSWSFVYRKLLAGLQDESRCVAPDFSWNGDSSARPGFSFLPGTSAAHLRPVREWKAYAQLGSSRVV